MNRKGLTTGFQERKTKQTLLIMTEFPPQSYRPAGERMFHAAIAGSSVFESVIVLSLRGGGKRDNIGKTGHEHVGTLLYAVKFVRGMLYPLAALFDPIKFLVFFVYGFMLSRRYKPLCIFASMPPLETGVCAWLLSKHKPFSLVIDLRDDWESALSAQFGRYFPRVVLNVLAIVTHNIYSSALLIFAATQTIAETVRRRGVTAQTVLVPNGADTSVFVPKNESVRRNIRAKYNLPQDKVVAVYCGSGTIPYYRLDVILSCLNFLSQEAKDKVYVVFYVYDGSEKLKRMQKDLGITGKTLDIRDPLPRKSLAEVLAACDVGLLPFDDDEYLLCAKSTKLYEYLSSGLHVVSSGPERGELDAFFSNDPALGLFIRPRAEDFARSLGQVLKTTEDLFGDDSRKLRYLFVRRSYDRRSIMNTAMKTLSERLR